MSPCVSEAEKYGGANFDKSKSTDKGDLKQSSWTDSLQDSIQHALDQSTLSPSGMQVLNFIKDYNNIPRKKKKFVNFVKNTCKWAKDYDIEQVWSVFEIKKVEAENLKSSTQVSQNKKESGPDSKQNLKRKKSDSILEKCSENSEIANSETESSSISKNQNEKNVQKDVPNSKKPKLENFKWKRELKKIVRENSNKISVDNLLTAGNKLAEIHEIDSLDKETLLVKISKIKNASVNKNMVTMS